MNIPRFFPACLILLLTLQPTWAAEVFGTRMFQGNFKDTPFNRFNPNYQIMVGDSISVKLWGAQTLAAVLTVDAQGNIFIPNVGPIPVAGAKNSNLDDLVTSRVRQTYRSNVGVYASLDASQPIQVYVTGYVSKPGLYPGLSSDSALHYLDKAGGVDPERGSFIEIEIKRDGQQRQRINLYDFLLNGQMPGMQLADGDTIVVGERKNILTFTGEVYNPYAFEFTQETLPAKTALALARPKPNATYLSIIRKQGTVYSSEYHPIDKLDGINLQNGDEINVLADKYASTILIRVEGAHNNEHAFILPYGAKLIDVVAKLKLNSKSNLDAIQINRKSVADRQKQMLAESLRTLEASVLTARSATNEESQLRTREAEQALKFIERAKNIVPSGRVVLGSLEAARNLLLEDGDVILIPEITSLVTVNGEVLFPNAILHAPDKDAVHYIRLAGGYTQKANTSRVLVMHANSVFENLDDKKVDIMPGDEIYVLPKIDTKNIEIARGITQILYQIALSARAFMDF